jgi:UDP-N-acetylglucosamine acyltransferase
MKAHPSALVDPAAAVADDVEIGPFCIVGAHVRIGPGCRLGARVTIQGPVSVGKGNIFHPHVTVGAPGCGRIEIGDGNVFRESTHVDAPKSAVETRIGSGNLFGTWVGLGAGSTIGNNVRMGALSALGEFCTVEDGARIEGQCVVDEGRRIGELSLVRSQVPVSEDVPPFVVMDGNPAEGIPRARTSGPVLEGGNA